MMTRKMAVLAMSVALLAVVGSVFPVMAGCSYETIASVDGYMSGSGDVDVWTLELTSGVRYNVRLLVGHGDDFDARVYYKVWTNSGWERVYVALGLEGTGVDESEYFTAPRNTKYYFEVSSWIGSGFYRLTLKRQFCF